METAVAKQEHPPVDLQTGEVQEGEKAVAFRNEFDVSGMLKTAGTIELTQEQKDILYASVNEDDIEIRYDGLIYCPWMEYATRLRKAFGLEWAIIPQGMPMFKSNFIYWGFWLVIKGHLCGYAIGEQKYFAQSHEGKDFMTYGDACEGAKSNALMRLCKGIGISLELWKPSFVREWKKNHAESYKKMVKGQMKVLWRRKGATDEEEPGEFEKPIPTEHVSKEESKPSQTLEPISEPQRKKMWAMAKGKELSDENAGSFIDWLKTKAECAEVDGKKILTKKGASQVFDHFNSLFEEFKGQYLK